MNWSVQDSIELARIAEALKQQAATVKASHELLQATIAQPNARIDALLARIEALELEAARQTAPHRGLTNDDFYAKINATNAARGSVTCSICGQGHGCHSTAATNAHYERKP